jgi:hypothetical protein
MKVTGKNWPFWVFVIATAWFVAIAVFWAGKPLVDRVPTTVAHVVVVGDKSLPGARDVGAVLQVTCGSPASSTDIDTAKLPVLNAANNQTFSRAPCTSYHNQSHILFFVDVGLYVVCLGGLGTALFRRRSQHAGTLAYA